VGLRGPARADPYGHGTHVAGLIANDGRATSSLYRGVAPNIQCLLSLRVLDEQGAGYTSDVIRAILWILTNQKQAEVDIINLSLGHPIFEPAAQDPLVQAVEAAVRAGIVVVVSAGNYGVDRDTGTEGYAGITSPGNAPSAITVGALDTLLTDSRDDDVVARYSSRGPTWYDAYAKPDIVAPGSAIVATTSIDGSILLENPHLEVETIWFKGLPHVRLSGTSMATAVTTGVVAHMIHAHARSTNQQGRLTPNAIKALLHYSALPMLGMDPLTQGAGGLNGDGAVRLAASIDSTVDPGMWWLAVPGGESSAISGQDYMWSQRIIWGDRLVWGDRLIWGNDYNDSVVWGDRLIWGNRLVWGDRLIWGNLDDDGISGMIGVQ